MGFQQCWWCDGCHVYHSCQYVSSLFLIFLNLLCGACIHGEDVLCPRYQPGFSLDQWLISRLNIRYHRVPDRFR